MSWVMRLGRDWGTGWKVLGRVILFYIYFALYCLPLTVLLKLGDILASNWLHSQRAFQIWLFTEIILGLVWVPFCLTSAAKASGHLLKPNETEPTT